MSMPPHAGDDAAQGNHDGIGDFHQKLAERIAKIGAHQLQQKTQQQRADIQIEQRLDQEDRRCRQIGVSHALFPQYFRKLDGTFLGGGESLAEQFLDLSLLQYLYRPLRGAAGRGDARS